VRQPAAWLLSLGVIDTPEQTKAVMQMVAADTEVEAVDYCPWQSFQACLATGEQRVLVPFAKKLADLIPPVSVRLRRDIKLLLTLIRAHALLHRGTRPRDDKGRIIASVTDYVVIRTLVERLFSEGIEATVPVTVRETVAAVGACVGGGVGEVSLTTLAKEMELDKNSVHHRVRKAVDRGFLVNREEKRGLPARIALVRISHCQPRPNQTKQNGYIIRSASSVVMDTHAWRPITSPLVIVDLMFNGCCLSRACQRPEPCNQQGE
jgi:hypothetical protein